MSHILHRNLRADPRPGTFESYMERDRAPKYAVADTEFGVSYGAYRPAAERYAALGPLQRQPGQADAHARRRQGEVAEVAAEATKLRRVVCSFMGQDLGKQLISL